MLVPSNRLTAALVVFASFAGLTQAADFDEKLTAPLVKGAQLKTMAENYSVTFARLASGSPTEMVTNKALFLEHFDLEWRLTRAVDDRVPLGDLSAIGLVKRADGGIEIDLNAHPQWVSFPETLAALMPTMDLELTGPLLVNRGFREADISAVRDYLASHDLKKAISAKTLPMSVSFSRLVKKYDRSKLAVSNELVFSFVYQRKKAEAEARRAWAEGLLGVLDAQRVRVLHSYFVELGGKGYWVPSDANAGITGLLAVMRLPDYEQRAAAEARGETP